MTASYISLFLGLFYFCYALKYYVSSFIALGVFNMDLDKAPLDHPAHRIMAQRTMLEEVPGDGPWVSIHLPFFNELNVARRILEACMDIDYLNFEIMVADDSRDATIEVLKEIRQQFPHLPVIMVTGYGEEMTKQIKAALKINAYACLYKPFEIDELLKLLIEVRHQELGRILGRPANKKG